MKSPPEHGRNPAGPDVFLTTRWSRVVLAGDIENPEAHGALASLCQDYWRPLYHFARRKGASPEDAQDLTQGFIMGLLEKGGIARADRARGSFRTFLLGAFCHYLANQERHRSAQKRGGGTEILSIDRDPETDFPAEAVDTLTPELLYERSWALGLLERVMTRLREEYAKAERQLLFETLQPHLSGAAGRPGYAQLGAAMEMSESAITVAIHRMRRRYGVLLREEVAATVDSPEAIEDELRHLIRVVSPTPGGA